MQKGEKPASLFSGTNHCQQHTDVYPSPVTEAFRVRLLILSINKKILIKNFRLTAPRAIRRYRFGQDFHHSPALCTVV